ncbi:carbohydrate ABC transporter permease [Lihuaxuella thermophila]|uniref:Multiple sugar transport system permease protein n=1 Tax=Lihuaxuella thermophila TaxID=1173111 RepID=A0A1H8ALH9_9BACL|nr:multiple sugar transport system permease protein [Lihuaxuella thermophila]
MNGKREGMFAFLFLLPFFVAYVLFTLLPMLKGLQMSLYKWTLIAKLHFVGLDQYVQIMRDPEFWNALWNTTYFVILSTPTMIVLALGLALVANRNSRLKTFYRSVFFLPSVLSVTVISYVGLFMFRPYTGLVNNVLKWLHVLPENKEIFWLTDETNAWLVLVAVTLWWTVGINMILYLSALQDIPDSMYEAARLDGATDRQLFWYITLPSLRPITSTILLLQLIASYKVFAQIWLITKGGPLNQTRPIIQYIYEEGFKNNNLGYAAAMSYVLFLILLILSLIHMKWNQRAEGGTPA